MKTKGLTRRLLVSVISNFLLAACSDVTFAPTADAPIIYSSGTALTDEFTQGFASKKLDILFVVDNSGSMAEEQERLGDRIDSFISTLHDIDWQIGITTTDVSDGIHGLKGALLPLNGAAGTIITQKTPNYLQVFKNTVVRRETTDCGSQCPSGDEQPLRAAIMAIEKRNTTNFGFFRQGADLGLLVLSDEDERSDGKEGAARPLDVVTAVGTAWADTKRLLTYGMIIRPDDRTCLNAQTNGGHYGTFVAALAGLTGGLVGSICENDYAPTLGLLGESARRLLEYVELRARPQADSIRVLFSNVPATDYRVEGRRVFFSAPPPKGTIIRVEYLVE